MIKNEKQLVYDTVAEFRQNLKQALDFVSIDAEREVIIKRTFQRFVLFEDNRG